MPGPMPNILYLHSHDTGRHVQPYGHAIPTPNIQRLADQGVLYRQAFCTVPACSGSRSALLTGQHAHSNGMLGLAHRGWALNDPARHIVQTLGDAGYWSGLIGEQHVSEDVGILGYDVVADIHDHHADTVVPAFADLLAQRPKDRPFFLSVGFVETHRDFREPVSARDALYGLPPANIPDTPETRRDMAAFKASARKLDQGVGGVLEALDGAGLAQNTLVIFTTDHGLAFPGAKATLTDRGLGVLLIMRGPGGFFGGTVEDALVTHLDLYPTICELAGIAAPDWLQGRSLLPLAQRAVTELHEAVFGELTFHAAYEPQRSVRTRRFKYIRRFTDAAADGAEPSGDRRVLANTDDSPSKDLLLENGWAQRPVAAEQLYDLVFDPNEASNVAEDPTYNAVRLELRERMETWMRETGDPLLNGPVAAPPGAVVNATTDVSPATPGAMTEAPATVA